MAQINFEYTVTTELSDTTYLSDSYYAAMYTDKNDAFDIIN